MSGPFVSGAYDDILARGYIVEYRIIETPVGFGPERVLGVYDTFINKAGEAVGFVDYMTVPSGNHAFEIVDDIALIGKAAYKPILQLELMQEHPDFFSMDLNGYLLNADGEIVDTRKGPPS